MLNRKKGNPNQLKMINAKRRMKTLNLVKDAVTELNSFGYEITIPKIMEVTNLSRGTFSLKHIDELLKELKIGKYSKFKIDKENDEIDINDFLKMQQKLTSSEKQILKQKERIKELIDRNDELVLENNILRMNIYELQLKENILN